VVMKLDSSDGVVNGLVVAELVESAWRFDSGNL
jgi:hypothetical protein